MSAIFPEVMLMRSLLSRFYCT